MNSTLRAFAAHILVLVLVPAVTLSLLEIGLWAFGVDPLRPSIFRGFDPRAQYFVPDPSVPGGFLTQWAEGGWSEQRIAPKSERIRVLLFGGSNTANFPADKLAMNLNNLRPAGCREFEVVNLGRSGYGSNRVAIVVEQAMQLAPDVILIYAGHNEFIEWGFARDVQEAWSSESGSLAALAMKLRSFRLLLSVLGRWIGPASAIKPEAARYDYERFRSFTYEQTLKQLHLYQENLRRICMVAQVHSVPVVLSTMVSNMLAPPFASTLSPSVDTSARAEFEELFRNALASFPERFKPLIEDDEHRVRHQEWAVLADNPLPQDFRLPRLRPLLGRLAEKESYWTTPLWWSPRLRGFLATLEAFYARDLTDAEKAQCDRARGLLERALERVPDHSLARFTLGLIVWVQGDGNRAAMLLTQAANDDRAPRKASELENDLVRQVAQEFPGARLFDAMTVFRKRCPDGIIGYEVMNDHCHLHPGTRLVLLEDFAPVLIQAWLAKEKP